MERLKFVRTVALSILISIFILVSIFKIFDIIFSFNLKTITICETKEQSDKVKEELKEFMKLSDEVSINKYEMLRDNSTIMSISYERSWDDWVYYVEYISDDDPFEIKKVNGLGSDTDETNLVKYIDANISSTQKYLFITKLGYRILTYIIITLILFLVILQIVIERKGKNNSKLKGNN